jgi:hypothetical protein
MIINLTQHPASPEQVSAGVVDLPEPAELRRLLTFDDLPSPGEVADRAAQIAALAVETRDRLRGSDSADDWITAENLAAMIGGAPFLMGPLEAALRAESIRPEFAFSRRESVEETQADGSVRKVAAFRHLGFVEGGVA